MNVVYNRALNHTLLLINSRLRMLEDGYSVDKSGMIKVLNQLKEDIKELKQA